MKFYVVQVVNPNLLLSDIVDKQPVPSEFVVFDLTTEKSGEDAQQAFSGGIINTPFIKKNADAVKATSKFWITNVRRSCVDLEYFWLYCIITCCDSVGQRGERGILSAATVHADCASALPCPRKIRTRPSRLAACISSNVEEAR